MLNDYEYEINTFVRSFEFLEVFQILAQTEFIHTLHNIDLHKTFLKLPNYIRFCS